MLEDHGIDPLDGAEAPVEHVSAWNVANGITILRLLLVPLFAWLLLVDDGAGWRWAALGVFLLASVTDMVDGEVARRHDLVTDFGKVADPIADKALTGTAFVVLALADRLWWWVALLVILREVGVTLLRFWVIRHGIIPASRGGKAKTALQTAAIGLYLLPDALHAEDLAVGTMTAAVVVTVATGADYVLRAVRLRRTSTAT